MRAQKGCADMGKIIAVCSGCGGVGKTVIAISLAYAAAARGKNVILLDASDSSRACDMMLGLENIVAIDMADVLNQQIGIEAALYAVPGHEKLRFASTSLCDTLPISELSGLILALGSMCDMLIMDMPTGESAAALDCMGEMDECIYVTRPDDVSLRAAERMIGLARSHEPGISVIINRSRKAFFKNRLHHDADTVAMLLDAIVLGTLPESDTVAACTLQGKPASACDSAFGSAIEMILDKLFARS